ncbi:hypothetical protein ATC00_04250 [Sinorhizobium americanum]|nr:hypothetical protein ATC00_04250 [Sinorhizobium americanum]
MKFMNEGQMGLRIMGRLGLERNPIGWKRRQSGAFDTPLCLAGHLPTRVEIGKWQRPPTEYPMHGL